MTERAIFIEDNASNSQSGPYSMGVMDNMVRAMMNWPNANVGVIKDADNELAASVQGGAVRIASGYAHVHGMIYWNDANVDLTPTTPVVGTTRKRIVVRKLWDDPVSGSISVKLAVVEGTDGSASLPALTQTDGTQWEIPICYFDVDTSGVLSNLTSDREYVGRFRVVGVGSVNGLGTASGEGVVSGGQTATGVTVTFEEPVARIHPSITGYYRDASPSYYLIAAIDSISGLGTTTITFDIVGLDSGSTGTTVPSRTLDTANDTSLTQFTIYFTAYG